MIYQVQDPQGQVHEIDGPDGASPDEIIKQAQSLIPKAPETSMTDVAKQAGREALATVGGYQPGTVVQNAQTNPVTQAKMLPPLAGAVGGVFGGPFSATRAQLPARALSDAALAAYGRPEEIPSMGAHAAEAVGTVAADLMAIPYAHKAIAGKAIGAAEQAAGVVTRAPDKLPTAGNVGEFLNTLESQIDNGTINTAQAARDAYAGTKYINSNPNLVGRSNEISVQAARVGSKAQALLNNLVKGRGESAAQMANAMKVPNVIKNITGKVLPAIRRNIIPAALLEEYVRRHH